MKVKGFRIDTSKLIGESQYPVYEATKHDKRFAAKHMKDRTTEQLKGNELCLHGLKKVHKNILQVETYCSDGKKGSWIFSPFCMYGNLIKFSKEHRDDFGNPAIKVDIMSQTTAGLEFIHSLNMVHRDIKPGNILITKDENNSHLVQITDFGEARDAGGISMKSCVGTNEFAAPEIYMNMTPGGLARLFKYDSKVDIFSLGLTFLAILQGNSHLVPKGKGTKIAIGYKMLDDNDYKPVKIEEDDDDFTKAIKSLILKMIIFDSKRRLTASQVKRELDAIAIHDQVKPLFSSPKCQTHTLRGVIKVIETMSSPLGIFKPREKNLNINHRMQIPTH